MHLLFFCQNVTCACLGGTTSNMTLNECTHPCEGASTEMCGGFLAADPSIVPFNLVNTDSMWI